jgi:hypothetical protein
MVAPLVFLNGSQITDPEEQVEVLYVAYYGRPGDVAGVNYWVNQLISGPPPFNTLLSEAISFGQSPEAQGLSATTGLPTEYGYPFLQSPATASQSQIQFFINNVYEDLFSRAADTNGLAYWTNQFEADQAAYLAHTISLLQFQSDVGSFILEVVQGAQNDANGQDITSIQNKAAVAEFITQALQNDGLNYVADPGAPGYNAGFDHFLRGLVDGTTSAPGSVAAEEAAFTSFLGTFSQEVLTLTLNPTPAGGLFGSGSGFTEFFAPIFPPTGGDTGYQPTLLSGDSLIGLGGGNSLVAQFTVGIPSYSNDVPNPTWNIGNVNIVNVQTWTIQMEQTPSAGNGAYGLVNISGDADTLSTNPIISGLKTVILDDSSTAGSLSIGTNFEPVYEPNGANGFTIEANNAFGYGYFAPGYGPSNTTGDSDTVDNDLNGADGAGSYYFYSPGVDVDINAAAFLGAFADATINIIAGAVGEFQLSGPEGSPEVPPPIIVLGDDGDNYNPNWVGYLADAFAFAAGASAGPTGPVGFTNWNVDSYSASQFSIPNIIALGGASSTSAQTITLTNFNPSTGLEDGTNTILYATALSDSLSTDWENVKTITLTNTNGFVTLTGLETDVQEVLVSLSGRHGEPEGFGAQNIFTSAAGNFAPAFTEFDGGGLLASDTAALITIAGGAGNSFYDLSSLTPAAATNPLASFDGGHGTAGNSEMSFNNAVFTGNGSFTGNLGGGTLAVPVNISHVQILDDVSSINAITGTVPGFTPPNTTSVPYILENDGEAQGGVINMANFAGLSGLNTPYALLAEDLNPDGGITSTPANIPFGLPFTEVPTLPTTLPWLGLFGPLLNGSDESPPAFGTVVDSSGPPPQDLFNGVINEATLLPSTVSVTEAIDLEYGVIPAGYEVLQLLDADGSTQTVLGAKLDIQNAPYLFAVNMQDTADGSLEFTSTDSFQGFDITIVGDDQPAPNTVNTTDQLILFVSDDGCDLSYTHTFGEGDDRHTITWSGSALYVPFFNIENYTTIDIVIPTESVGFPTDIFTNFSHYTHFTDVQDYVILGGTDPLALGAPGFDISPIPSAQAAVVNFFDNNADNGGSPPGGEDDLVLGFTNFTASLNPTYIGVTSVSIDTIPSDYSSTINDFSTGSLEIGATNVTNLNGQATSHVIMDLPATLSALSASLGGIGINVNGSLVGQNLLQGTSGAVQLDFAGHDPSTIWDPATSLVTSVIDDATITVTETIGVTAAGTDNAAVYEAQLQHPGQGWGNDTLTGGDGFGTIITENISGALGQFTISHIDFLESVGNGSVDYGVYTPSTGVLSTDSEQGPGNFGDNFFPEGGKDVVNIAAGEIGTLTSYEDVVDSSGTVLLQEQSVYANFSTVWVGFYDVCNSAGPDAGLASDPFADSNTGVGTLYDQAITDLGFDSNGNGAEVFVDGYGNVSKFANDPTTTTSTPSVTINGFNFEGPLVGSSSIPTGFANPGDTIVFGVQSWASTSAGNLGTTPMGHFSGFGTVLGLVESDGETTMVTGAATYAEVSQAGAFATILPPDTPAGLPGKVIVDSIAPSYADANALQGALSDTTSIGDFKLAGAGMAGRTEADILVAYQLSPSTALPNGAIAIADVTLTNTTGGFLTDTADLNPVVHDLVHITTTSSTFGLGNFGPHNIWFEL